MPYASATDITDLMGDDMLIRLADRDGDGIYDDAKVTRALDDASALIDGYIAARVPLPLITVPPVLKNLTIDIAVYRLSTDAALLAEDVRTRYEDAIKFLRDVAAGKAQIPQPKPEGAPAVTEVTPPQAVIVDGPPRLFSRSSMRRL